MWVIGDSLKPECSLAKRSKKKGAKGESVRTETVRAGAGQSAVPPRSVWRRRVGLILFAIALTKLGTAATAVIEHFDEGVYASNFWFGPREGGTYPARWFYAPPFLAWVIENLFLIAGPSNFAAILPSAFCGLMTVLLSAIAAKRWSDPVAGWVAISLGMLSGYQTTFAQTALTDVPLGMWWVISLVAIHQGCTSGKVWWGIIGGVACAAGWWTKYNGWMPLGIALGGLIVAGVLSSSWRDKKAWITVGLAVVTAVAIWSPYYLSLESVGGYGAINENHRGYIVGPAGWPKSLVQQWRNFERLNGFAWGMCEVIGGWLLAVGLTVERSFRSEANGGESGESGVKFPWGLFAAAVGGMTGILALAVAIVGAWVPMFVFAISGLMNFLGDVRKGRASRDEVLGKSILGVWFVGMFLATPLYTPYARLMVPLVISMWIGAAIGMRDAAEGIVGGIRSGAFRVGRVKFILGTAVCLGVALGVTRGIPGVGVRGSLKAARYQGIIGLTEQVVEAVQARSGAGEVPTVLVYADPALFFQLRLAGATGYIGVKRVPTTVSEWRVAPIGDLSFVGKPMPSNSPPVWLVVGPGGVRDSGVQELLDGHPEVVKSEEIFRYDGSDYVVLDQYSPTELDGDPMLKRETVRLYRIGGGE